VAAETLVKPQRQWVQIGPARGIVGEPRAGQDLQRRDARVQVMVDRRRECRRQALRFEVVLVMFVAHVIDRQIRRQQRERRHAAPDEPGQIAVQRHRSASYIAPNPEAGPSLSSWFSSP
jgi:hypothetical protein